MYYIVRREVGDVLRRILVDLDDVLIDLLYVWIKELNRKYGLSVRKEDIGEWDITKSFPTLTEEQIFEPLFNKHLYDNVPVIPGAKKYLEKLCVSNDVFIVTATPFLVAKYKFNHTIFKEFPFIAPGKVIISSNKQLVKGDVLIDDHVNNLVGGSYQKILFTQPHNSNLVLPESIKRANSWKEVYEMLEDKMHSIIVYTIGCPKCNQLERKLLSAGFCFERNTNREEMEKLGMKSSPYMSVDGKLMDFAHAWAWINANKKEEIK